MDSLHDYGHHLKVEEIVYVWLVMLSLPIASGALALSVKKKLAPFKEDVVSKRRSYWRASFALGLASGISNLISGPPLLGSWPFGLLTPFLMIDGALIVYGNFCVLQKKFTRGALPVLVPGILYGFYGLPLLLWFLMGFLHIGYPWIFALSTLEVLIGLAFPIASSILAIYSRE